MVEVRRKRPPVARRNGRSSLGAMLCRCDDVERYTWRYLSSLRMLLSKNTNSWSDVLPILCGPTWMTALGFASAFAESGSIAEGSGSAPAPAARAMESMARSLSLLPQAGGGPDMLWHGRVAFSMTQLACASRSLKMSETCYRFTLSAPRHTDRQTEKRAT